jgi:hypothetical protein
LGSALGAAAAAVPAAVPAASRPAHWRGTRADGYTDVGKAQLKLAHCQGIATKTTSQTWQTKQHEVTPFKDQAQFGTQSMQVRID